MLQDKALLSSNPAFPEVTASWCTFTLLVTHRALVTTFPPSHLNLSESWSQNLCGLHTSAEMGSIFFFLAPHVNYSPLWAVQNCFSRAARNTAALSEQIKGEVPNPVVLEKREISASQQLFAALVQPGWGIINHCGAPAKSSAPPHAPVCQRSRILLKQHLVNIQIPGNSHTPCCHTGFLRLWFPMCSSQSWTLFFQLVGRQLLERLERQALGKDMGTLQHFHETAVRQAPSTSQQHDRDAGQCMATWPLAGLATPQSQEWNLKTEHSILPFVYPNLPRPSSNVQLRNSFHYFV